MVFWSLNYIEQTRILVSIVTGCVIFSIFGFLVPIVVGIARSAIGLKISVITAAIKYKLLIQKKDAIKSS